MAILTRFGIRRFKLTLCKAAEKLDGLCTAEGMALPENTRAELRRHLARLRLCRQQIRAIEQERLRKLAAAPAAEKGPHEMVPLLARFLGVGAESVKACVVDGLFERPPEAPCVTPPSPTHRVAQPTALPSPLLIARTNTSRLIACEGETAVLPRRRGGGVRLHA